MVVLPRRGCAMHRMTPVHDVFGAPPPHPHVPYLDSYVLVAPWVCAAAVRALYR